MYGLLTSRNYYKVNNEDNLPSVRTHISIKDDYFKMDDNIIKEKEKDIFKKIISMSIKQHKYLSRSNKDKNIQSLFPPNKLKPIPSNVRLTQYQIYETLKNQIYVRNENYKNEIKIVKKPLHIKKNNNYAIDNENNYFFSMSAKLNDLNNKKTIHIIKNLKSNSHKGIGLPKVNNCYNTSYKYKNNISKLNEITKNLKLEYTRLHFRKNKL